MSNRPHGTAEPQKRQDAPPSHALASPAPAGVAAIEPRTATLSRLAAVVGASAALPRLSPSHRQAAILALQPTMGNAHVQRVLSRRPQPGPVSAPGQVQRDPKRDKAALEAAKQQAAAAGKSVDALEKLTAQDRAVQSLGASAGGREVKAFFFKGAISDVALVVAGVHGSELSGVEIAEKLIAMLNDPKAPKPFFTVVIVPQLFPDNVAKRRAWEKSQVKAGQTLKQAEYVKARDAAKDPGRITPGQADPNRQFPELGKPFDPNNPVDAKGRPIEAENIMLLTLIDRFKPSRIASLHAIKDPADAGIFADPHPSVPGLPADQQKIGKKADQLALLMAELAKQKGANVAGNFREKAPTSLYPGQDPKISAEQIERENKRGRSLGQWGPSQGALVLTIEVSEQWASDSPVEDKPRKQELEAHAAALREIFLGPAVTTVAMDETMELLQEGMDYLREGWRNVREQLLGGDAQQGGGTQRSFRPMPGEPDARAAGTTANGNPEFPLTASRVSSGVIARQPAPDAAMGLDKVFGPLVEELAGVGNNLLELFGIGGSSPVKHYSLNPEVTLSPDVEKVVAEIADAYFALTQKDLVVTSGTRTAESQARAMYVKLEIGDDVLTLYGKSSAVKEIKKAYDTAKKAKKTEAEIVAAMTTVIEGQIAKGRYISKHLQAGAVDIRSRDMSAAEKKAFRKAVKGKVTSIILETKPPHWHLQI